MKKYSFFVLLFWGSMMGGGNAIMERGDYPWGVKLRSFYDQEMAKDLGDVKWLLNLGPTGIRARIYPNQPKQLVVKYVFQDKDSPAKGLVNAGDIIVGANGKKFKTPCRFGRRLPGGGGWDGPMLELAGHLEDSQGKDGKLQLMVWPGGDSAKLANVTIQLKQVGRFAPTFPYNCERSDRMLEELCDWIVMDYESGNWKKPNSFHGGAHCHAHQLLALMASGNSKYDSVIKDNMSRYYGRKYNPADGGFKMWPWGFDSIVMGEYYLLTKDSKLKAPMKSLAEAMPWGSHNKDGIYTHRSHINIRLIGRKPYASIAAISGLQMVGMSLFRDAGLPYDEELYQNIHQHYLNSTYDNEVRIAYAFGMPDRFNSPDITRRHAIIKVSDKNLGKSGKGPGYVCPTGMQGITDYEVVWPTKKDPRWKPLDWLEKERATNIVTELKESGTLRVDRNHPDLKQAPELKKPLKATKAGSHLAPIGMGAVAHLIGPQSKEWRWLGTHAANTLTCGPGNIFDGHAGSNLHGFWSILGGARGDDPKKVREFLDYAKTFVILSETHNGGLILQPWGRDRPNCNGDVSYGPRTLPTATGAILLALGKKKLRITGAGSGQSAAPSVARNRPGGARAAREFPGEMISMLDRDLLNSLGELSQNGKIKPLSMNLTKGDGKFRLLEVKSDRSLVFEKVDGSGTETFGYANLALEDQALMARLVARLKPKSSEAQAYAGIFMERLGDTKIADGYYRKSSPKLRALIDGLFQ